MLFVEANVTLRTVLLRANHPVPTVQPVGWACGPWRARRDPTAGVCAALRPSAPRVRAPTQGPQRRGSSHSSAECWGTSVHSWKVPAVPFLALLRPGKDVVLAGEEDKELFKSTGRTVCSGGNHLAHGRCSRNICEMMTYYHKTTLEIFQAKTTCI